MSLVGAGTKVSSLYTAVNQVRTKKCVFSCLVQCFSYVQLPQRCRKSAPDPRSGSHEAPAVSSRPVDIQKVTGGFRGDFLAGPLGCTRNSRVTYSSDLHHNVRIRNTDYMTTHGVAGCFFGDKRSSECSHHVT